MAALRPDDFNDAVGLNKHHLIVAKKSQQMIIASRPFIRQTR
jgi:hypothetical protein